MSDTLNPLGRAREKPQSNPLTYFERISLIRTALAEKGIDPASFGFVPFPIERPKNLAEFVPVSVPCYTTICEPWNREKIDVLRGLGYIVHVLWEHDKTVTASRIRELILQGDDSWKSMVPQATVNAVEVLGLKERLRLLVVQGS